MLFMTLCGGYSPMYDKQLDRILIELIERTYGDPPTAISRHGGRCGRGGCTRGGVVRCTEEVGGIEQ